MRYNGINHLAMATGDMQTTIRFWRDLLGMRLVGCLGEPGFRHYFFEISPNDLIAFFEWDGAEAVKTKPHGQPVRGPFVFDHIAFGIESSDEVWELKDKLDAAGFNCSNVINHGFIHSIYAFDPNGIPIEFCYNVAGTDIRHSPMMADSLPSAAAQEGSEPQRGHWPAVQQPTAVAERRVVDGAGSAFFATD